MRHTAAYSRIAALAILATPMSAQAGTKVLYRPDANTVGTPIDPIEAMAIIRRPIDRQHGSGWPCGTTNLPIVPISSYVLTGQKLTIRCASGLENEFRFKEVNVVVQRDGCGMLEWPCTVVSFEPALMVWSGNRRFSMFFHKKDEEWAKTVANAVWSLGNARTVRDPRQDNEFLAKISSAPSVAERAEEHRRIQVQAETLIAANRLTEAAKLYRDELERSPAWADGHFNLALVYGRIELIPEAITEMRRYLHLSPNDPRARDAQDQIYAWEAIL